MLLKSLADEIESRAGGASPLADEMPIMLRECIDALINTPRTGRRDFNDLEKVEKTFIGTHVEIVVRKFLRLEKGILDTVILGHDVDIKFTTGDNWTIPPEAYGHPCLVIAADEERSLCYMGLIIIRPEVMHAGAGNRDAKRGISTEGFGNILWLLCDHPYPPNFWRTVESSVVERITSARSGNERVVALFENVQGRPISRDVIDATARQKDFTRRTRADNGRGSRDTLLRQGILLLTGTKHPELIQGLGLPFCRRGEYISYSPKTDAEWTMAESHGIPRP
ncbi:NaeI family type II restriction endonuclease [Novosphingobium resinovorum]|uniref:NaeI family type II restriction endonuclease n=1 Tax=Novosphingobium resinovorum TaxID=158500 RepID=UPI0036080F66